MLETVGDVLPNAVAIAISPLPIIAVILLLMSSRPQQMGLGFLVGWMLGILFATTASTLLSGIIPEPDEKAGSQPVMAVIQILLGVFLLLLGVHQWRSRPAPGDPVEHPNWMSKLDSMKVLAVAGFAFVLASMNPKNLLLAAAAGTVIGRAQHDIGGVTLVILIFTLLAALTVLTPVAMALIAPRKATTVLAGIRDWLGANNAAIMTVVLLILGMQIIGKGIGNF